MITTIKGLIQIVLAITTLLTLRTLDNIYYDRYAEEMRKQGKTPL